MTKPQILIESILREVKNIEDMDIVPTAKNKATRYKLGLTVGDYEDIIKSLSYNEYYQGPLNDHDTTRNGDVWIFKKHYGESILYIKFKIVEKRIGKKQIKCLSCHLDYE